MAYTDFLSTVSQMPRLGPLLPLQSSQLTDWRRGAQATPFPEEAILEPSPEQILDRVVPPLVRALALQAFLEAQASEHAARMMAMRNATDAASEVLTDLTRLYNQARQASITQEIAEISGGKSALESR
jgi:F-type H+-transporting ATPase subunit gamma